jgi:hypothetical protein
MKVMARVTLVAVAFAAMSQFNVQNAQAGLFAKLFGCKKTECCCEPEPVCCEPAPEPVCCEPAPAPEPAPEPCCAGVIPPPVLAEGELLGWISPVFTPIAATKTAPARAPVSSSALKLVGTTLPATVH